MIKKLRENKGETLAEVLAASLIGALALILLASMIMSSTNMISSSQKKIQANYDAFNHIEERDSTLTKSDVTVTITDNKIPSTSISITVKQYTDPNTGMIVYEKDGE